MSLEAPTSLPSGIASLLEHLDPEQRALLEESPRAGRLPLLAQFRREKEIVTLQKMGALLGLEVREDFTMPEDVTARLPLRLVHEYQCLPVDGEEETAEPGEATATTEEETDLPTLEEPPAEPLPLPKSRADGPLELITLWPPDEVMDDWVYTVTGRTPRWILGPSKLLTDRITQNFGVGSESLADSSEIATDELEGRDGDDAEDENAALIRFVNEVIAKAVEDRATDIHFEPLKESLQIRYRIDGELVPIRLPENLIRFQSAIISRLKIMAKLNISEKRRPQDGRIYYRQAGHELDIRISTMPTMYGESLSLRLLNKKQAPPTMEELGMSSRDRKKIERVLGLPYGIILVTGPTGSGKSTSLNAFIRQINLPGRRIITIEDPVEYEVEGVNQTQVNSEIGFTFATALRHTLRQDPDVIMVGEIRDGETADIGIRAALTGHLVLSTIHTNDAPGALTRLIDMDIEPFLIASAVELIIAQRLVRRLCPQCRAPDTQIRREYLRESLQTLQIEPTEEELAATVYKPVGCEHCRGLGYRGRIGIFEILRVDDTLHDLIVQKKSAREIRQRALGAGMVTLQESGWEQVKAGTTSLAEVLRFSTTDEDLA